MKQCINIYIDISLSKNTQMGFDTYCLSTLNDLHFFQPVKPPTEKKNSIQRVSLSCQVFVSFCDHFVIYGSFYYYWWILLMVFSGGNKYGMAVRCKIILPLLLSQLGIRKNLPSFQNVCYTLVTYELNLILQDILSCSVWKRSKLKNLPHYISL